MFKEQTPVKFSSAIRCLFCGKRTSIRGFIVSAMLVFLVFASAATLVNATETREIELADGSVITGEVVSLSGGFYTVRSAMLGTLRIEASKIRVIRSQGSATPSDAGGQVKSLEDKMLGDSEIMDAIGALQNDPDLQKII